MRRREFTALFGGFAASWVIEAEAEQRPPQRLVGVLQDLAENETVAQSEVAAFREALGKLGWTEGKNVRIEVRWGASNPDRIQEQAKVLVGLQPDVIVARGTPATRSLASETRSIPIVFVVVADPLGAGFAESLAHPGRNITGFSNLFSSSCGQMGRTAEGDCSANRARHALVQSPNTRAASSLHAVNPEGSNSAWHSGQHQSGSDLRRH